MAFFSKSARGLAAHISKASPPYTTTQTPLGAIRSRANNATAPGRRNFHLGAVGDAVLWTADSITFLHHTGLPWFVSIPLVAVGVNFTFRLPVQYYTRRLVVTRNKLTPLVTAWSARHAATVPQGQGEEAARLWRLRVAGLTERSRARIYKSWGVQRWKSFAPFLSMAPFIIVSEALRRLCGAPTGWLSHTFGLVDAQAVASAVETSRRYLDESLVDGGCLWFTDLTAMDPYFALPIICSALLARTSWGRLSKDQLRALLSVGPPQVPQTPAMRIRTAVGRTLLLVPLFPILFADLPSAIFLYWASTFALNDVNEAILGRLFPHQSSGTLRSTQKPPIVLPYLRSQDVKASKEEPRPEQMK
ncbi:mitochondrial export translocase Oxa2 [Trichoderma reesei RUT C-30]|jgi:inner membrane protein COX18|uniref:Mitochondrial export translocase Oxa2 n=2 Tax=Hypocrea jecorina TaxID=51453 RepID=A0A024S0Q2_HYPJR|nr:mitochondrial export translocase Oxa2 [Trichoderma reesei RUT C-30]